MVNFVGLEFLRLFLFCGMVLHKIVWEVEKRRVIPVKAKNESLGLNIKSGFKILKIVFLIFLLVQTLFLDVLPIPVSSSAIIIVGVFIYLTGLTTAIVGRIQLGKNWVDFEDYQVLPGQNLVRAGLYRFIRHPIYIGDALLVIGLELALNSWLFVPALGLLPLVYWQARREELKLVEVFPDYKDYQQQTRLFIPFLI